MLWVGTVAEGMLVSNHGDSWFHSQTGKSAGAVRKAALTPRLLGYSLTRWPSFGFPLVPIVLIFLCAGVDLTSR